MKKKTASTCNAFCSITRTFGSFCIRAAENFRTVRIFLLMNQEKWLALGQASQMVGRFVFYFKQLVITGR